MIQKVAIGKGSNRVESAKRSLGFLGGIKKYVKPGDKVFIKPNFMMGVGMLCNTHPDIIRLVVHECKKAGAKKVIVGETAMSQISGKKMLEMTLIKKYLEKYGATVLSLEDEKYVDVDIPNAVLTKKLSVPEELINSDVYINMPKLKTHCVMKVSLGIKNSLGLLKDEDKAKFHRLRSLSQKLVDIVKARPPDLVIVDSFIAMEGQGPGAGTAVKTGVTISGNNIVGTDTVCCKFMGINPLDIETIKLAYAQKLGSVSPFLYGEKINDIKKKFSVVGLDMKDVGKVKHKINHPCFGCKTALRLVNTFLLSSEKMSPRHFKKMKKSVDIIVGGNQTSDADIAILVGDCAVKNYKGKNKIIKKVPGCPITNNWLILIKTILNSVGGVFNIGLIDSFFQAILKDSFLEK